MSSGSYNLPNVIFNQEDNNKSAEITSNLPVKPSNQRLLPVVPNQNSQEENENVSEETVPATVKVAASEVEEKASEVEEKASEVEEEEEEPEVEEEEEEPEVEKSNIVTTFEGVTDPELINLWDTTTDFGERDKILIELQRRQLLLRAT